MTLENNNAQIINSPNKRFRPKSHKVVALVWVPSFKHVTKTDFSFMITCEFISYNHNQA